MDALYEHEPYITDMGNENVVTTLVSLSRRRHNIRRPDKIRISKDDIDLKSLSPFPREN